MVASAWLTFFRTFVQQTLCRRRAVAAVALEQEEEEVDWRVELMAQNDAIIVGIELRWHRLVQQLFSIRHLQRVFRNTGQRLKEVGNANLRARLSKYLR